MLVIIIKSYSQNYISTTLISQAIVHVHMYDGNSLASIINTVNTGRLYTPIVNMKPFISHDIIADNGVKPIIHTQ